MRNFITTVTIVINVLSLVALVSGVLLHSGRGGGLSDMFGGGGGAALGSAAAERNLNRITTVTIVINVLSLVALVSGVLLHSGRGGGLSDMFGGGGGAALGSAAAERNLNRITTVFALVWVITVIALGMFLA